MKNRIYVSFLLAFALLSSRIGHTQVNVAAKPCDPFEMHISATELMQAYQNLVLNKNVSTCIGGVHKTYNVTGTMHISGYVGNTTNTGTMTFGAFYLNDTSVFRTIWGMTAGDFTYYAACVPNPLIFPLPANAQNHVYEARLIPVTAYQATTLPKNFTSLRGVGELTISGMSAINNIRLEPPTGYINRTEPNNYSALSSSKGVVCDVYFKGKKGATPCYIINNYDGTGTLEWKVKKDCSCCINFDKSSFKLGKVYNKPNYKPGSLVTKACDFNVTIENLLINGTAYFNMGRVDGATASFGSGNIFNTNNVTLLFKNTGSNPITVSFDYLNMGGTTNLSVNGNLYSGDLKAAPPYMGGLTSVKVTEVPIQGGRKGTVTLDGYIKSFSIGGQEFFVDNICRK